MTTYEYMAATLIIRTRSLRLVTNAVRGAYNTVESRDLLACCRSGHVTQFHHGSTSFFSNSDTSRTSSVTQALGGCTSYITKLFQVVRSHIELAQPYPYYNTPAASSLQPHPLQPRAAEPALRPSCRNLLFDSFSGCAHQAPAVVPPRE
eukprot:scaffold280686_cov48-Prasinocladus_malaysianus.AAC.1